MDGQRVFILGPARSGTSLLFLALHEALGLPGEGESHVVPAFQRAIHAFALYREGLADATPVLAHRLNIRSFRAHVIAYMRRFYAEAFPGGRFVDKTPGAEAIAGAALIREAFPEALIILTRRNGIQAVQSHRRKFHADFGPACRAWAACMQAIEEVRPVVPDLLEIDHGALAAQPVQTAERIASRLGQADVAPALAAYLRDNWSGMPNPPATLEQCDWSESQKAEFRRVCGPAMQRFGYRF
jgi:hypothetical protein